MNRIVYIFSASALLIVVNEVNTFKTYGFRKGSAIVNNVCDENFRIFSRGGVPSSISCASACTRTTGCDAVYFSAINGSCTGCRKTLADASYASTANVYYQLVNDHIREWSNGTSRYLLDLSGPINFADAKVYCQQFGAHVVVPDSQVEQDSLALYLSKAAGVGGVWIGIFDKNNKAPFLVEHSEEVANYTNWYPGEPNQVGVTGRCVSLGAGSQASQWFDVECNYGHEWNIHVVCEHG